MSCFAVTVVNHITKLSFTWTCSPCQFTVEQLPLRRRPSPCMGHKGFIYLFNCLFIIDNQLLQSIFAFFASFFFRSFFFVHSFANSFSRYFVHLCAPRPCSFICVLLLVHSFTNSFNCYFVSFVCVRVFFVRSFFIFYLFILFFFFCYTCSLIPSFEHYFFPLCVLSLLHCFSVHQFANSFVQWLIAFLCAFDLPFTYAFMCC